jgi:pimeloyl-ACP methyl ester carboxylesterase
MWGVSGQATAFPASLRLLVGRFDPDAFDIPRRAPRVRLRYDGEGEWDAVLDRRGVRLEPASGGEGDALLAADAVTWRRIASDVGGGMEAWRAGRLVIRRNLHLALGFLAATSGLSGPGRLVLKHVRTRVGYLSTMQAGEGEAVVLIHGLGATKASLLPTLRALAPSFRVIALDLPGFGDSVKPIGKRYDPPFFARGVVALLDELELDRAHFVGNSLGGRVALEMGMLHPDRTARLAMLCPSLAWLRRPQWTPLLRLLRPELGLIQPAPRRVVEPLVRSLIPGASESWIAVAVDEFLRLYLNPRGRAALYAAARQITLEEPEGRSGFWPRLREMGPDALFIWGRHDRLVPAAFAEPVREALPRARHLTLDCGHVPQLEAPRQTHQALTRFLEEVERPRASGAAG